MLDSFIVNIVFFSACLSVLISFGQFLIQNKTKNNINLVALFLAVGMGMFQLRLIISNELLEYPILISFHITIFFFIGFFLSNAYSFVINPDIDLPVKKFFNLIPAVMPLAFDFIFILKSESERSVVIESYINGENTVLILLLKIVIIIIAFQVILFFLNLLWDVIVIWKVREKSEIVIITLMFSIFSTISILLTITGYLMIELALIKIGSLLFSFLIIGSYLCGQHYPEFLQFLSMEVEKKRYERSLLNGVDIESVKSKIIFLMEHDKIFLDEDLSLRDLADELDLSPHQLSQFINEQYSMNLKSFINKYRISEAKDILLSDPDCSILSTAYAVGFNSKSAFYEAFSRFTGLTPQKFRYNNFKE